MIHERNVVRQRMRREAKELAESVYPGKRALITAEGCLPVAQYDVPLWTVTFFDYSITAAGLIERVTLDSLNVYFAGEHERDYRIVPKIEEK